MGGKGVKGVPAAPTRPLDPPPVTLVRGVTFSI